jgi:citrate lyase beta subunit
LYTPADNERLRTSAFQRGADSVIIDLEDAVAPSRKTDALDKTTEFIARTQPDQDTWVRINTGERGLREAAALANLTDVNGLWVAKAEPGPDFDEIVRVLDAHSSALELGVMIESARGVRGVDVLLGTQRVTRVQLGEVDLRADLGMAAPNASNDGDLDWVRGSVVLSATFNDVQDVVGPVSTDYTDLGALQRTSDHLLALGFTGRASIHPAQIAVIATAFAPSADELERANRILDRFEQETLAGRGAYRDDDGFMADAATIRHARQVTGRQ